MYYMATFSFVCLCLTAFEVLEADHIKEYHHFQNEGGKEEGRFAWGFVGDAIEYLPFFPITINVPDIIYGIGDMMSSIYQYFTGGDDSTSSSTGLSPDTSTPRLFVLLFEKIVQVL